MSVQVGHGALIWTPHEPATPQGAAPRGRHAQEGDDGATRVEARHQASETPPSTAAGAADVPRQPLPHTADDASSDGWARTAPYPTRASRPPRSQPELPEPLPRPVEHGPSARALDPSALVGPATTAATATAGASDARAEAVRRLRPRPAAPKPPPVGHGHVFGREDAWRSAGASDWVTTITTAGYELPCELDDLEIRQPRLRPLTEHADFARAEIAALLQAGAIEEATGDSVRCVLPIFVVSGAKLRLVLDCRAPNEALAEAGFGPRRFTLDSLRALPALLDPGDLLATADFHSAFHQVSLAKHGPWSAAPLFGFHFEGKLYRFVVLPFGFSHAPFILTAVFGTAVTHMRRQGVRCLIYLDDLLLTARGETEARTVDDCVGDTLTDLGLTLNPAKGFAWATSVEYLGYIVSTAGPDGAIYLADRRQSRLLAAARAVRTAAAGGRIPRRMLERLVGHVASSSAALPAARALARPLHAALGGRRRATRTIAASPALLEGVDILVEAVQTRQGAPLFRPAWATEVFSDASDSGFGASRTRTGAPFLVGHWTEDEARLHINVLEIMAIERALEKLGPDIQGQRILLRVDNTTALTCIRFGSAQPELHAAAARVWRLAARYQLSLLVGWVPTALNDAADGASRAAPPPASAKGPAVLTEAVYRRVTESLPSPPSVDAMARQPEARLTRFWDYYAGDDALARAWEGEHVWCEPPPVLIPRLLAQARAAGAPMTLLAPRWPTAPWWPALTRWRHGSSVPMRPGEVVPNPRRSRRRLPATWAWDVWHLPPWSRGETV